MCRYGRSVAPVLCNECCSTRVAFVDQPTPAIRFTRTDDGVDIAFWEIGVGDPVVILNNFPICHAELEWTVPSIASFYTEMAKRYRVIRYDPRGFGLSSDPPGGWGATTSSGTQQGLSTTEMGLDISAVASALDLEDFTLMGVNTQGPVAIEYTANHPEVSKLILCSSFSVLATSHIAVWNEAAKALDIVSQGDGPSFSVWQRITPSDEIDQLMKLVESTTYGPNHKAGIEASVYEWDAEQFLQDISVPTLIISARDPEIGALPDSRHLAAAIGGSHLNVVDGPAPPYWTDPTATFDAIDAFLKPQSPSNAPAPPPLSFRTVVFTDIVESTEYVRRVGDEEGRTVIRELEQQVAALASGHGGHVVKNLGDGSLVSFGSNSSAISFALGLQDACSDGPLALRVGMAAGEPIQEDGDIHGTVVAHASRIGDLGDAGEVIVSDSVRQLAAGKGFTFEPRGEVLLKGFDEPEKVWKVTPTSRP
jgi:pimeloyl-ACP methyl ester carboxylesterase